MAEEPEVVLAEVTIYLRVEFAELQWESNDRLLATQSAKGIRLMEAACCLVSYIPKTGS